MSGVPAPIDADLRDVPPRVAWALEQAGVHPLLARLFAARGVRSADELDDALGAPAAAGRRCKGAGDAARAAGRRASRGGRRICVVADYDCDGATACAVALRGLRLLGAAPGTLHYVVPDRARARLRPDAGDRRPRAGAAPDVLVTVDNGIASLAGRGPCARARPRGAGHRPPPAGAASTARSCCPTPT